MIDGRYLSAHIGTCPTCGPQQAIQVFTVCDHPHREEAYCANCKRTISVNGRRVTEMHEATMAGDGQGRR